MNKKLKNEKGVLIIEASIVFPVMFLVIFFLIYAGNVYLQVVRVEAIVQKAAIEGASMCSSALYENVVYGTGDTKPQPYRFLSGRSEAEDTASNLAANAVRSMGDGLLSGMQPYGITANATYHNYFVYSYFDLEVKYKIKMPIALLFSEQMELDYTAYARIPTTDTTELVRNIDFIDDLYKDAGGSQSVGSLFDKLKDKILKFGIDD